MPTETPKTPRELAALLPKHLDETARIGVAVLLGWPRKFVEDATVTLDNLLRLPRTLAEELLEVPGRLAEGLMPANVRQAISVVKESAEFQNITDPRELRNKMRTLTDVLDLFTPT